MRQKFSKYLSQSVLLFGNNVDAAMLANITRTGKSKLKNGGDVLCLDLIELPRSTPKRVAISGACACVCMCVRSSIFDLQLYQLFNCFHCNRFKKRYFVVSPRHRGHLSSLWTPHGLAISVRIYKKNIEVFVWGWNSKCDEGKMRAMDTKRRINMQFVASHGQVWILWQDRTSDTE